MSVTSSILEEKSKENHTENDLNQDKEKSTVIDYHMRQGKAIRPVSFGELPSEGDPDGEEKEDDNGQIGMDARSKDLSLQIQ
jgi:hypothetical protein